MFGKFWLRCIKLILLESFGWFCKAYLYYLFDGQLRANIFL